MSHLISAAVNWAAVTWAPAASRPARNRRRGAITLEWVLLVTVIIIGTVGAVAAVRNELVTEYVEILETICKMSICES